MRDMREVIDKIIREIPNDPSGKWVALNTKLRLMGARPMVTTEKMQQLSNDVAHTLERALGDPDEEWKRRIASIFAGRNSI